MRVLKWFFLFVVMLAIALCGSLLFALHLGLQPQPAVLPVASAQPQDIASFTALLDEHDPRDLSAAETRQVYMTQREINIGLGVALPFAQRQHTRVAITPGLAAVHYSLRLVPNPIGEYFNASILVSESDGRLAVESLRLGDTDVSGLWLRPVISLVDATLQAANAEYRDSRAALQSVRLRDAAAEFVYSLDGDLVSRIESRGRSLFLSEADEEAIRAYYNEIVRVSQSARSPSSLMYLLRPLFSLAQARSDTDSAAAENRALLLTLGVVLNGSSVRWLLGQEEAARMASPETVRWTLYGRDDLAQHFGISAAMAVGAGGFLADAIGVFKELSDSRGGTGFSFVDLLADRAGVELANHATGASATIAQQQLSMQALQEFHVMPDIRKLPEGLAEMTFRVRYRDLDDERYAEVKREVDTRVAQLPVYRSSGN